MERGDGRFLATMLFFGEVLESVPREPENDEQLRKEKEMKVNRAVFTAPKETERSSWNAKGLSLPR